MRSGQGSMSGSGEMGQRPSESEKQMRSTESGPMSGTGEGVDTLERRKQATKGDR